MGSCYGGFASLTVYTRQQVKPGVTMRNACSLQARGDALVCGHPHAERKISCDDHVSQYSAYLVDLSHIWPRYVHQLSLAAAS